MRAHVAVGRREGVPEVEVEVVWLALLRPRRDPAELDVHRGLRDAGHRARVDTGLLRQFALSSAGQRGIGRLKVAARLQDDPVRARCSTRRISVPRTSSAPAVTCTGKLRREAKSPPRASSRTGSDSSAASSG
jgi:hypothetical protein